MLWNDHQHRILTHKKLDLKFIVLNLTKTSG